MALFLFYAMQFGVKSFSRLGMQPWTAYLALVRAGGVGMAVSGAVIMYGFGLDHWMLWAFLFFAMNYITYIDSVAACVPPLVMASLDLDSPAMAALLPLATVLPRPTSTSTLAA